MCVVRVVVVDLPFIVKRLNRGKPRGVWKLVRIKPCFDNAGDQIVVLRGGCWCGRCEDGAESFRTRHTLEIISELNDLPKRITG